MWRNIYIGRRQTAGSGGSIYAIAYAVLNICGLGGGHVQAGMEGSLYQRM